MRTFAQTLVLGVIATLAPGSVSHARYLVVWRRTKGQWKLHRDIWNAE